MDLSGKVRNRKRRRRKMKEKRSKSSRVKAMGKTRLCIGQPIGDHGLERSKLWIRIPPTLRIDWPVFVGVREAWEEKTRQHELIWVGGCFKMALCVCVCWFFSLGRTSVNCVSKSANSSKWKTKKQPTDFPTIVFQLASFRVLGSPTSRVTETAMHSGPGLY